MRVCLFSIVVFSVWASHRVKLSLFPENLGLLRTVAGSSTVLSIVVPAELSVTVAASWGSELERFQLLQVEVEVCCLTPCLPDITQL